MALRVPVAWMEHPSRATAARVALAEPAEREPIAVLVALAAVVVLGQAAVVVLVLRALAARAALAVSAALAGMRVVSLTARLVVMPDKVALVVWAGPLARRARTPHRWSAARAASAATPESLVVALRVPVA